MPLVTTGASKVKIALGIVPIAPYTIVFVSTRTVGPVTAAVTHCSVVTEDHDVVAHTVRSLIVGDVSTPPKLSPEIVTVAPPLSWPFPEPMRLAETTATSKVKPTPEPAETVAAADLNWMVWDRPPFAAAAAAMRVWSHVTVVEDVQPVVEHTMLEVIKMLGLVSLVPKYRPEIVTVTPREIGVLAGLTNVTLGVWACTRVPVCNAARSSASPPREKLYVDAFVIAGTAITSKGTGQR